MFIIIIIIIIIVIIIIIIIIIINPCVFNSVKMTLLSMASRRPVRVPAQCAVGLGFNCCRDSYFVFVPCLYHVD